MGFTATPGTPGTVQPGYACTGIAVWQGPFPAVSDAAGGVVTYGQQITVPLAVASQLALSDPSWWTFH